MKAQLLHLWRNVSATTLLLTLVIWVCVLPFILILTIPFLGWQVGLLAAAISLFIALVVCYAICYFPKIQVEDQSHVTRSSVR